MSMHLARGLTTISTKKKKDKITKAKQEQLERDWKERNVRLKQMGLPKESFEQFLEWVYGRGKKEKTKEKNWTENKASITCTYSNDKKSQDENLEVKEPKHKDEGEVDMEPPRSLKLWVTGPVASKPSPVYTGTKVKGIGTMHKSNAVPIFTDDEAIEISRMRR